MVVGADGLGFIAYSDGINYLLKTAHCSNVVCTSAYTKSHDPEPGLWEVMSPSVGINADGLPVQGLEFHIEKQGFLPKRYAAEFFQDPGQSDATAMWRFEGQVVSPQVQFPFVTQIST